MIGKLIASGVGGILVFFGCVFVLAGFFDIQDITKLHITRALSIDWMYIATGALGCLVGIAIQLILHFSERISEILFSSTKVRKLANGNCFEVTLSGARVAVHYGRLEEFPIANENWAVVLPGNEFFDDECIKDERSALGAFMRRYFPMKILEMHQLILERAATFSYREVEKEAGITAKSFGVGKCIFIDKPLGTPHRIILASVSTKRARVGLKSEASFICAAISEMQCLVADKRINGLVLPVMGSGHGGLKSELALFAMVLAFSEVLERDPGKHAKKHRYYCLQARK